MGDAIAAETNFLLRFESKEIVRKVVDERFKTSDD